MLTDFWEGYKETDPDHPVYESGQDLSTHVPYMIHGDEGRGKGKVPILVESIQPLISYLGIGRTNQSGQLGLS